MIDYQEHITALRVLIVSGAVRGRTVEYSGDKALAMTDHLNAIETALAAAEADAATLRAEVERLRGAAKALCDAVEVDDGSDHHYFTISGLAKALRAELDDAP